ncbi:MAG: ABC transporter permease, partial [Planctomycetota bacterium]
PRPQTMGPPMVYLPLANILHYKLRSLLSAVGIGIGICMMITLAGLSRGSVHEVADRWEAVHADLIVMPRGWADQAADRSGVGLSDKYAEILRERFPDEIQRVTPVLAWVVDMAGQHQRVIGVEPDDWKHLTGERKLLQGRVFDPENQFARWIERQMLSPVETDSGELELFDPSQEDLSAPEHDGLELVIDDRLARAGNYRTDQQVHLAGHDWTIVGIVDSGVLARVFMPRRTAQYLFTGDITKSTMMFVKLREGVSPGQAAASIRELIGQDVVGVDQYRQMFVDRWGMMFTYVDAVNIVALVIAFLFIMVTLYTMVLQRTREVAILKASGAGRGFLIRQVLGESFLLTGGGTLLGIAMAFGAGALIETFKPLLTVSITAEWVVLAILAAVVGALVSAAYPAWRACRVDMLAALNYE